jgi:hypothetical protein
VLQAGATAQANVVFGNFIGIDAQSSMVNNNRVYANTGLGIRGVSVQSRRERGVLQPDRCASIRQQLHRAQTT